MVKKRCLNCGNEAEVNAYCSKCGQKNDPDILNTRHIFREFLGELFSLDSKAYRTLKTLMIPAKLTKEYIAGRRNSYLNPARLFIVTGILLFAAISFIVNIDNKSIRNMTGLKSLESSMLVDKLDSLKIKYSAYNNAAGLDSIQKHLFDETTASSKDTFPSKELNIITFADQDIRSYGILYKDVYDKTLDSIYAEHHVQNFWHKFYIRQYIKFELNPVSSIKFTMNNILWSMVPVIFLTAAFLMLLYFRQKPMYIELLALLSHLHSFLFLYFIFLLAGAKLELMKTNFSLLNFFIALYIALPVFYTFMAFKNYFKQSVLKTLFKTIMVFFFYIVCLSFSILFFTLISFLLL